MQTDTDFIPLPKVAVLIPQQMRGKIFPQSAFDALASFAEPVMLSDDALFGESLADHLAGVTAVITGWKSPKVPTRALAPNGSVTFVSHAAGSVKPVGVLEALQAGHIRVSHSAPVIAGAVAEFTLAQILAHLRRHREMDTGLRTGEAWFDMRERNLGQSLGAQEVGLVGLGYVGRLVLGLLRPFGCNVSVYDPFISQSQADALGVRLMSLEALFAHCSVVSLHAANLPTTEGMVTARHLALLQTGALLVNTARAGLVEPGAMVAALRNGRIFAALDVFDVEPLPEDEPLRMMKNVYLSPHCAGHTSDGYVQQGLSAVDDVRFYFAGQPLRQEIRREIATTLA